MIVLDTSVLAYAVGGAHPLREPSRRVVRAIESGAVHAQTTTFVIQEFLHVAARRRARADAARLAGDFSTLLAPLLAHDEAHVSSAVELFVRHERLGPFDAFLAAAARAAGAQLISADHAFAAVPDLRFVDLASAELDTLLARG